MYNNKFTKTSKGVQSNGKSAAIYSAALQDHFMKKFTSSIDANILSSNNIQKKQQSKRKSTVSKLPSIKNIQTEKKIAELQKQQKKSILPYEDQFLKKLKQEKSEEAKMSSYNKKLTWAQKLGIVEAPPLPLSSKDWAAIEEKSKARNDSDNVCSICIEDFKNSPQVILSCSHVFHEKCLSSYERHNKVSCCPICRHKDYQKKVIDDAIRAFTLKSIIRVQRVFRGSRDRIKIYSSLVDNGYKAQSVRFNRRLIGFKMWRISQKISDKAKRNEEKYKRILSEISQKNEQTKNEILQEMVEIQRKKIMDSNQIEKYLDEFGIERGSRPSEKTNPHDWNQALNKAVNRKEEECSICLMKLWGKPVYLLSCSHMFHVNCIEGFERYSLPGHEKKCPCCRAAYSKKLVDQGGRNKK